jgi:hypothetical protein
LSGSGPFRNPAAGRFPGIHSLRSHLLSAAMTILEHTPERHEILDFIDESIRQLQSSGAEAKYIILGAEAY